MGHLVDGAWTADDDTAPTNEAGGYVRALSRFRDRVSADGSTEFKAAAGRYHLFVAHNCPWAHRAVITRRLKGLEDAISMSIAMVRRGPEGWVFADGPDGEEEFFLHHYYTRANRRFSGRVTVPVLWDRERGTIVNNESADIIVMLDQAFAALGRDDAPQLYPAARRAEIDAVNDRVYADINNGVYRCGFARRQEAYEEAFHALFGALDAVEARLDRHRYLAGAALSLADVRLFPTLVRFDAVYYSHFKCNLRRIADYSGLSNYLRDLYQTPGFGDTVRLDLYKQGYYGNSPGLNPRGIIPLGPEFTLDRPHDRARRRYATSQRGDKAIS